VGSGGDLESAAEFLDTEKDYAADYRVRIRASRSAKPYHARVKGSVDEEERRHRFVRLVHARDYLTLAFVCKLRSE
jgi:hypothetical protein